MAEIKKKEKKIEEYEDIIQLPHPDSTKHLRMTRLNRAAQFSPFAALTGYDSAIKETARLTNQRMELDENTKVVLDEKLRILQTELGNCPYIGITYFKPDEKKEGGEYVTVQGNVQKMNPYQRLVIMSNGVSIPIEEIIDITGDIFRLRESFD